MRFHNPTTTISLLFLLAVGVASLGYGLMHPDNGSMIFGSIDLALCVVLYTSTGNKKQE